MHSSKYEETARNCRIQILNMVTEKNAAFVGSSFSAIDVMTVLNHGFLHLDPSDPFAFDRDFFFLSKGHAASALYAVLRSRGVMCDAELGQFCAEDGALGVHPKIHAAPGIEASTGSLGHAFGLGCGVALANRIQGSPRRVYVLMGDGECNEGSVWEAAMFAAKQKLGNLTVIVDRNRLQSYGHDEQVLGMGDMAEKFRAFGLHTMDIDGHDCAAIHEAFEKAIAHEDGASVIVANTVKGKGVSYMEDQVLWHYKWPDKELREQGMKELMV